MPVSEEAVLEKLKNVIDPELFVNVVDLGLIYEVNISTGGQPSADSAEASPASASEYTSDPVRTEVQPTAKTKVAESGGTHVSIDMTMTSPACPAGPQLIAGAKREVATLEGVGDVEVKIVMQPPWTPDRMTEDAKDQLGIF